MPAPEGGSTDAAGVLGARPRVPEEVARRAFPDETVLLNLKTGQYHGLNETAGVMVEELERAATVADAAERLADRFDVPRERLETDLVALCRSLEERGLLELAPS